MTQTKEKSATKVIGGPARFSYAHVFKPVSMDPDDAEAKKKYSVCLLIPKANKALVTEIRNAIKAATEAGKSKWGGKIPNGLKIPLRDGDEERSDDENYKGMYFINASSDAKPGIVDASREPITSEDDFYSGCWGRFSVNFFAFNAKGNKGIGCGLNHLQKTRDGERLSGRASVEDDFNDDWQDEEVTDDNDLID